MFQNRHSRESHNRLSPAVATIVCLTVWLVAGSTGLNAVELTPPLLEETAGAQLGLYSERTLSVALEIDREKVRLVTFAVKDRAFRRSVDLPEPRTIDAGHAPQIEVVLLGPGELTYTQRIQPRGICLLHQPDAEPHIAGDTIRLHRETLVVEVPDIPGFDWIEVAYRERDGRAPQRRSLGIASLEAESSTSDAERAVMDTSGAVHWPEEYGDTDIYRVEGDESEVDRRINITFVPDGYTYAEKALMESHFDEVVAHFRNKTPQMEHDPFVNYILVYAYSTESGTDQCDCDIIVDTAMGTRFPDYSGSPCMHSDNRCIYYGAGCDTDGTDNIVAAELRAPASDKRAIMVNTSRHGGCGGYRAVYGASHSGSLNLAVHELGHSMGGLNDEYVSYLSCGTIAGEINTSTNPVDGAWPEWIADLGPPWEGGQYYSECIYRPEFNCTMRNTTQPFCKVCQQHLSLGYFGHPNVDPTAPLEAINPESPVEFDIQVPTEFSVTTRLGVGTTNDFTWTIEGPGYPGPTVVGPNAPRYIQ